MTWDTKFIGMADLVASWSKDRSTKVGAVIVGPNNEVLSVGYNGFPRKVNDDLDERHERPVKYQYTEHAERNSIYNAARHGIRLEGTRIYLNWEPYPCPDCTRAIIQAGIRSVVGPNRPFPGQSWQESFKQSRAMMEEAGVEVRTVLECLFIQGTCVVNGHKGCTEAKA